MSDAAPKRQPGGRVAAVAWSRGDLRRRWRSLVVLGVLAGVTGGFALAALSGARRTDTASASAEADQRVGRGDLREPSANRNPDFAGLARRPEVKAFAGWNLMFGELDGEPGGVLFAPSDRMWAGVIDKPVVLSGRMFDPRADDEMVVDETLAHTTGTPLGKVIDLHLYVDSQDQSGAVKPKGPDLHLRVVGVVRNVQQFLFVTDGQGIVSPGAIARYGKVPDVSIHENAYVQLRDPARDAPTLQRDVNAFIGPGTPILDFHEVARRVEISIAVERSALLLLFLAVAAAGGVLVGQALIRSASVIGADVEVLRAIGMTRRELVTGATLPHALTAVVAAVTGVSTALIASRWFPLGVAARIDPDRGVRADWMVLAPGILIVFVVVLGAVSLVARRTSARSATRSFGSRSGLARWLRRSAPVAVGVGASMALDSGGERTRVAVRPALVGAMVGVLGVTAALTINHGLRDALAHPARAGVTWDVNVVPKDSDFTVAGLKQPMLDRVRAAPGVAAASLVDRELIAVDGVGVPTFMLRPIGDTGGEPIALTLTAGRPPRNAGEGTIGPATARELRVGVGDEVRVGTAHRRVKIVGEGLFPSDVHAGFDQGLWLTPAGFVATAPPVDMEKQIGPERVVAVRFASGVPSAAASKRLTSALGDAVAGVGPADVPVELTNLRNVRTLPVVLAVFLALLAIAAAWHVLITSARVRRREFAILRALGLTRRGMRTVLSSQSTTIGAIGLLIGTPFGVIGGRLAWAMVTGRVPLEDVPPLPAIGVALLVPGVIVIANLLAFLPGRRVVGLRPAQVLRTE